MISDTTALRSALVWAAGGRADWPGLADLDEGEFSMALSGHRLEGRILARLESERVTVPESWRAQLVARHDGLRQRVEQQMRLYLALRQHVRGLDPAGELIPLKGFQMFVFTGAGEHVRHSDDIDVIAPDPDLVVEAAAALGRSELRIKDNSHEYAEFRIGREQRLVDLHSRYLIPYFGDLDRPGSFEPASHPGRWRNDGRFGVRKLTYADLKSELVSRQAGNQVFPLLTPEAGAILRCAHLYSHYLKHLPLLPIATVRLDELALIRELTELDWFDRRRFEELCSSYDAGFAVGFARALARDILGWDLLPDAAAAAAPQPWYPRDLWWDGIDEGLPVNLGWSPEQLILRSPGAADIAEKIGSASVPVSGAGRVTATILSDSADELPRYVFRCRDDAHLPVQLELQLNADSLCVTAGLPAAGPGRMSAIAVECGDNLYEAFFRPAEAECELNAESADEAASTGCSASAVAVGRLHRLSIRMPWPALGRAGSPSRGDRLPLLFKARQQDLAWGPVQACVVAPITLCA